ncbi:MAG: GHMP kinase [Anaerolineaceae bacterium]|nr:GHMP kinase [Anaerolineaceae bacterium]
MIIVQTPLRISFFGGGTDFSDYYLDQGGCVLSTTIDKYIFVTIKQRFDDYLRVGWTKTEIVETVDEIQHELIREALKTTGIKKGIEITTMGDIPAGTGLGSSSTVTIGALHAMYSFINHTASPRQLAEEACKIEIDILNKPIGVQDQYIAAYGGLRLIEFNQNNTVTTKRVDLDPLVKQGLNENLLLFYTGMKRQASDILGEQQDNIKSRLPILSELKSMAYAAADELKAGNIDFIGKTLHDSWKLKKQLASKISNGAIDQIYETARDAGALGGKLTGAGGGGFLLLYCRYDKRDKVRKALSGLREIPIKLEPAGSKVIFDYRR